jgi:hypothetical protein
VAERFSIADNVAGNLRSKPGRNRRAAVKWHRREKVQAQRETSSSVESGNSAAFAAAAMQVVHRNI